MPRHSAIDSHVLIYDGDCAFCTLWVNRLRDWLPVFPDARTSQSITLDSFALTKDDVEKYAWYITPSPLIWIRKETHQQVWALSPRNVNSPHMSCWLMISR